MGEGLFAIGVIGLFILIVALFIACIFVIWTVSGYICTTFNWYALDQNAQIFTTIFFLIIGGSGVLRSSGK